MKLVLANEISPMAAETYAFNFFNEDLNSISKNNGIPNKTLWISSSFPASQISNRLKENPFKHPDLHSGFTDLLENAENLNGSLLVGNIIQLNQWLLNNKLALNKIRNAFGNGEIDLLSGGPPCQSFSMAGLRDKESEKNSLPWEFACFAKMVKPKVILLENVSGILRPFKVKDNFKYYAWFEIAKAFAKVGYVPLCLHVNAKFAGVPQNRPRFILLGLRKDLISKLEISFNESEILLLKKSINFFKKMELNKNIIYEDLICWDIKNSEHFKLFNNSFLNPLVAKVSPFISVFDAIDDLRRGSKSHSNYKIEISRIFKNVVSQKILSNHELRANNDTVKRRFRLYQLLNQVSNSSKINVLNFLASKVSTISNDVWLEFSSLKFYNNYGKNDIFKNKHEFILFLKAHKTKKRSQRALLADQPAPAALSIPDDACHYHPKELRTLTVREMARIQSFPDFFQFRSKVTTGGKLRKFEVPQYTQVGNAVPPLLGRALGLAVVNLLDRL